MTQHKSWAMSAIVIGTYLCAVCFAADPTPTVRPLARTAATRPAAATPMTVVVVYEVEY